MTETPALDVRDHHELLPSGRVRLWYQGKCITLREVRLGELKKLKRAYFEVGNKVDGEDAATRSDQEIDLWVAWLRQVVDLLGDEKLPTAKNAADSLPAYWATLQFASVLLNHWMSDPLSRGEPEATEA